MREMNLRAERLGLIDDREGTGWQDHVRNIAKQTRSNDIDPGALADMGRESAERFLAFFPESTPDGGAREALIGAVEAAIDEHRSCRRHDRHDAPVCRAAS